MTLALLRLQRIYYAENKMFALLVAFQSLDTWNEQWNTEPRTLVKCKGVVVSTNEELPGGALGDWICGQQNGRTECGYRNVSFSVE